MLNIVYRLFGKDFNLMFLAHFVIITKIKINIVICTASMDFFLHSTLNLQFKVLPVAYLE